MRQTNRPLNVLSNTLKARQYLMGKEEYHRDWHSFYKHWLKALIYAEKRFASSIENRELLSVFQEREKTLKLWLKDLDERFMIFLPDYKIEIPSDKEELL